MESILVDFYKNLFSKDNLYLHVQQSLIDDLEFTLSDSERVSCEGDLTKDELFMALGGLQTGKSPGSDGLPTEFYKAFWQDLGDVLVLVLNERFHTGILTDSQREDLLRLLVLRRLFAGGLVCFTRMFFLVLFVMEVCLRQFFLEGV